MHLVLRLRHVVQQKFQNQGASQATAFDFEIGKAHGEIDILNVRKPDEPRIGHGSGKLIAFLAIGGRAGIVRAVLSQVFAADILVAGLPVLAAKPAAFVAQEFHLVLLGFRQGGQLVKSFVQPKIWNHIPEVLPVHFLQERWKSVSTFVVEDTK